MSDDEDAGEACDLDSLFAYDTTKEVKVLDRRLGMIYYSILLLVLLYVVLYVFMIKKQYLDSEKTTGWILTKVLNPSHTFSDDGKEKLPWDVYDAVTNPGEQGAIFLPTRILRTKMQTQKGYCASPLFLCAEDVDCDVGNDKLQRKKCLSGKCERRGWCPPEDPNADTTDTIMVDAKKYLVWFSVNLQFHKFAPTTAGTTEDPLPIPLPHKGANTYPVHDLLRLAQVDYDDIQDNGAILIVNIIFTCELDDDKCVPQVQVAHVDSTTGFNYVINQYYSAPDRRRDTYRIHGLRIFCFATGMGTMTSFSMIVLQVSSAIALLGVAATVADFVLQNVLPERNHYVDQKVIQTENFNEE